MHEPVWHVLGVAVLAGSCDVVGTPTPTRWGSDEQTRPPLADGLVTAAQRLSAENQSRLSVVQSLVQSRHCSPIAVCHWTVHYRECRQLICSVHINKDELVTMYQVISETNLSTQLTALVVVIISTSPHIGSWMSAVVMDLVQPADDRQHVSIICPGNGLETDSIEMMTVSMDWDSARHPHDVIENGTVLQSYWQQTKPEARSPVSQNNIKNNLCKIPKSSSNMVDNTLRQPARTLRSSDVPLLIKRFTRTEFAKCAFQHSAPTVWNSLPKSITNCDSLPVFKSRLKTYFFCLAFN